jgi:hypothetical protein
MPAQLPWPNLKGHWRGPLWWAKAKKSHWVRDEAAAGRDRDRLIPTTIDGTQAPLGFRQFQTIDLTDWKRGARSRRPRLSTD